MNYLHHSAVYIVTVVDTKTDGRTKTLRVGPYFEEDAARAAEEFTAAADLAHMASRDCTVQPLYSNDTCLRITRAPLG